MKQRCWTNRLVHESRFEIQHNVSNTTPRSTALSINVLSAFSSGSAGNKSSFDNYNF